MLITTLLGGGCIAASAVGLLWPRSFSYLVAQTLWECGVYHTTVSMSGKKDVRRCEIRAVHETDYGYDVYLRLPIGLSASDIAKKKESIEAALGGEIIIESEDRNVRMRVGRLKLRNMMPFTDDLFPEVDDDEGIFIPLYSRFGVQHINFNTEVGAHMLIGGATGMGKSKILDLILTLIIVQTRARAKIVLINNKLVDAAPYEDIPCVSIYEDIEDARSMLDVILEELNRRKYVMKAVKATNIREVRHLDDMKPIFLVVDEFARFSDDDWFQKVCIEIAERGRSFDIHLIVATQRPDANEVLKPRIKANCATKIAFKTTTASNSRVILEVDDAYHLPQIQGRAIIQRSTNMQIQVPYLSEEQQAALLAPYKKGDGDRDNS
jgi:energy-coupling factor transporter ATP-binding protein EcfA2